MREQDIVYALLRSDFTSFLHRCVRTLNPGSPFLPNWCAFQAIVITNSRLS